MKYIKRYESIDWEFVEEEESSLDDRPFVDLFEERMDFYDFLVKNNALDKWVNNMKKNGKDIKKFLKSKKDIKKSVLIEDSFTWSRSNEGDTFWYNIYRKLKDKGL